MVEPRTFDPLVPAQKIKQTLTLEEFSDLEDPKQIKILIVKFEKKFFGESVSNTQIQVKVSYLRCMSLKSKWRRTQSITMLNREKTFRSFRHFIKQ